ncbi:MAG: ATP-binding protein [Candidatus Xenobia bacterium]
MQLSRLEVKDWRGLSSAVLEFDKGITIVGGPNESGKTSLRSALRAALLLPTGARGEKKLLESHRPWDSKLYPRVQLDFVIDGVAWTVVKEFLRSKEWASLRQDGRLYAYDGEAQAKVLELLGPAVDWFDVLWGVQGEIGLDKPAPESLKGRLAEAAQDTVIPQVAELQRLIGEEYEKYWTPQRKTPKKKVQSLRDATMKAEGEVRRLRGEIEAADQRAEELERKNRELDGLKGRHAQMAAELHKAQESLGQWEAYARAQSDVKLAQGQVASVEQWLTAWCASVATVQKLWPQAQQWIRSEAELKAKLGPAPSRGEVDALTARQKYLDLALARERYAAVEAVRVPSDAELKALRTLEETLRDVDARLKVGAMRARLTADVALQSQLNGQPLSVVPGATETWTAEQGFELVLPGVARLEVESGNPAIAQDVARRDEMQKQLQDGLARWESATVSELNERVTSRAAELKQMRKVDARTVDALRSAVPDADALDSLPVDQREQLLGALPSALMVAETTWKTAQMQYEKVQREYQELLKQNVVPSLQSELKSLQRQVQAAPDPGLTVPNEVDDAFVQGLASMAGPCEHLLLQLQAQVVTLQGKVSRPAGDEVTSARLQQLRDDVARTAKQVEDLIGDVRETMGVISGQADLYAQLVAAEEACERATTEQRRVDIEAAAMRELFNAFESARAQLQKDVLAPLQSRVSERFAELTAGFYRGVAFDPSLRLGSVATDRLTGLALDDNSFGTREQLSLLTRVCLAELLAESTCPQVVILDDNLVHTDDARMATACRLLERAAETVQVVVFTCHPERYQAVSGKVVAIPGRTLVAEAK